MFDAETLELLNSIRGIKPVSSVSKTNNNPPPQQQQQKRGRGRPKKTADTVETSKVKEIKVKKHLSDDELWGSKILTTDEVCQNMLLKAQADKKEEPDFDYRLQYAKGERIWYVNVSEMCGTVDLEELIISKVYPRVIIAYIDQGMSRSIDYKDRDMIFNTPKEAENTYKEQKKLIENRNSKD